MGFLADIAGGLGQATLNKQQTELLRFLEEERFQRQQEAQIQAEERATKRQLEAEDREVARRQQAILDQTLLGQIATGRLPDSDQAEAISQVSEGLRPAGSFVGENAQKVLYEQYIDEALNAPTSKAHDVEVANLKLFASEAGIPMLPEVEAGLAEARERLLLAEEAEFIDRQGQLSQFAAPSEEQIAQAVTVYGPQVEAPLRDMQSSFRKRQIAFDNQRTAARLQTLREIGEVSDLVATGKIDIDSLSPEDRQLIYRNLGERGTANVVWTQGMRAEEEALEQELLGVLDLTSGGQFPDPELQADLAAQVVGILGIPLEDYMAITNQYRLSEGPGKTELIKKRLAAQRLIQRGNFFNIAEA